MVGNNDFIALELEKEESEEREIRGTTIHTLFAKYSGTIDLFFRGTITYRGISIEIPVLRQQLKPTEQDYLSQIESTTGLNSLDPSRRNLQITRYATQLASRSRLIPYDFVMASVCATICRTEGEELVVKRAAVSLIEIIDRHMHS